MIEVIATALAVAFVLGSVVGLAYYAGYRKGRNDVLYSFYDEEWKHD